MVSGGPNGGPQYSPMNISLTGGDGQNPKSPELEYRGLGYRTTGETNKQAKAAPIKEKSVPRPKGRAMSRAVIPDGGILGETMFQDESILEGSAMQNPQASMLPARSENPDYQTIVQYLPAMEWWATQPGTPQTTKDYVRFLRTII